MVHDFSRQSESQPAPQSTHELEGQPSPDGQQSPNNELAASLLDAVLRETMGSTTDAEAHEMISQWLNQQSPETTLDHASCRSLVAFILQNRFRGWEIPTRQAERIAERLWEDPGARQRLELLWDAAKQR